MPLVPVLSRMERTWVLDFDANVLGRHSQWSRTARLDELENRRLGLPEKIHRTSSPKQLPTILFEN